MRISALALLVIVSAGIAAAADIQQLLDSLEKKLSWIDYRYQSENWEKYTGGEADSLDFYTRLYRHVTSDQRTLRELEQGKSALSDPADLRRWELVSRQFVVGNLEQEMSIAALRDSLSNIDINYRAEFQGEKRSSNHLYQTYRSSSNRTVREEAYRAYNSIGLLLADGLTQLFQLRNRAAISEGYNNYLRLTFQAQGLDVNEYKALLDDLEKRSRKPYRQLLNQAKERLGLNQLEEWDLGFAYAAVRAEIDQHFPVDSQLIYIKRGLKRIDVNLDKMPIYFDLEAREGKSQFAYAFLVQPPFDMRVMANLSDGIYSTRVLMHEIGHAIHASFVSQERLIFRISLSSIWTEGMAQFMAGFTEDPIWLTEVAGAPRGLVNRYLKAKKEQDIIYLRKTLLRLNFELEAYTNPHRDLNKLYWSLFAEFMFMPRHEDINPWAAVIHYTTHPVYLQNYLYADMIAAQTLEYLTRSYGNVTDNRMTKAFLVQNYMRFGSRYDWQELLERGTESRLNPDFLIKKLGLD